MKPCKIFAVLLAGGQALAMSAMGQTDTLSGESKDEVVVTATRTERKLSNVAVPALLIGKAQLEATQLRRLNELLQEQTGIFITSGSGSGGFGGGIFGNGAQLQGMSPEYTLILINGEPIVGRQGGTLNLSRLALSHIKKVEVIKGPASSLYGSEAMGGVINIITDQPNTTGAELQVKGGGYGLFDATANAYLASRNTKASVSYNHYRLGALDFGKEQYGNQQDPFANHTVQAQLSHRFNAKLRLIAYARYFNEQSDNAYEVADAGLNQVRISGNTKVQDANLNTSLLYQINNKVSTALRLYGTGYQSRQDLQLDKDGSPYYFDEFNQQFYRVENQTDIRLHQQHSLTLGAGYVYEHLNTTRYEGERSNTIAYAFAQEEWKPTENFNLIAGLRYDANQAYASRLSPKLALRYSPSSKLKLRASYGAGFKAPDFRQLYLSFINNASAGYALFGANEISVQKLQELKQQGFIGEILDRAYALSELRPETSDGLNAGATYSFSKTLQGEVNLFYNDIRNQILFDVIALRPNGSQVFSYFNVARSFTTGAELNMSWQLHPQWQLSGGYQFVLAADKAVMQQIKDGTMYGREEGSNEVYQLKVGDYYGLPGRSRHMANLKLMYAHKGWQAAVRAVYRNRWGTFDKDGNGIINRSDETAEGFVLLNATVTRQLNKQWRLAAGVENMLNHRDAVNLPNIPGINAYAGITFLINQTNK